MIQQLIWIPKRETVGPIVVPYNYKVTPKYLWTLYHYNEESIKPILPYIARHNISAFLESSIHDYDIRNGNLYYYSRITDGNVWLLLEFCK